MSTPSQRELMNVAGISQPYASLILKGERKPARPLAIHIFRRTGWKHDSIAELTEDQIEFLEWLEPYKSPTRPEAR